MGKAILANYLPASNWHAAAPDEPNTRVSKLFRLRVGVKGLGFRVVIVIDGVP